MAAIEIYYISRMPRERKSDRGKNPDRNGNIILSPEKYFDCILIFVCIVCTLKPLGSPLKYLYRPNDSNHDHCALQAKKARKQQDENSSESKLLGYKTIKNHHYPR